MNRQVLIKEYADYGFTVPEICDELNLEEWFVNSAMYEDPPCRTEIPAKSISKIYYPQYAHATDKTIAFYELIHEHGSRKINRYWRVYGLSAAAQVLECDPRTLFSLKIHFGYERPLPGDALDLCLYFPEEVRRQVDDRDQRTCVRCHKKASDADIRYHKISHPGPVSKDNCATLCKRCRSRHVNPFVVRNRKMFKEMRFDEFVTCVKVNAPFIMRDRIYPKGQIGTW
jgi:hypothetical protein